VLRISSNQTIVVSVPRVFQHPRYKKVIRTFKNYLVHDPESRGQVGDLVSLAETRPISARKRHVLVEVLGKGKLKLRELPARPAGGPAKRAKEEKSDTGQDQATGSR
jgi:small subunit ribosomal protein S17